MYRGGAAPSLTGRYFFTDFCNTAIKSITFDNGQPRVETPIDSGNISQPVAFGEDVFGEIYVASLAGSIHRIVGTGATEVSRVTTLAGQCLHAPAAADATGLVVWPCGSSAGQRWVLRSNRSLFNPSFERCVDAAPTGGTRGSSQLRLRDCNDRASQQFAPVPGDELRGVGGLCVDHSRRVRRQLQLSACDGADSQVWMFTPAPARGMR